MTRPSPYPVPFPEPGFKPLTLGLLVELGEAAGLQASRAIRVTEVLCAGIESLDQLPFSRALARRLSAGTRAWLLMRLAGRLTPGRRWFSSCCNACQQEYDFELDIADVPTSPAKEEFPRVSVSTSIGLLTVDVPNGVDEEVLATLDETTSEAEVRRFIIERCASSTISRSDLAHLSNADLDVIDAAIEEVMPQTAEVMTVDCPACGASTEAAVDPLEIGIPHAATAYRDIHQLARTYHWSESEIRSLSLHRSSQYLALIHSSSGRDQRRQSMP